MRWSDVTADPRWQEADAARREEIRDRFFQKKMQQGEIREDLDPQQAYRRFAELTLPDVRPSNPVARIGTALASGTAGVVEMANRVPEAIDRAAPTFREATVGNYQRVADDEDGLRLGEIPGASLDIAGDVGKAALATIPRVWKPMTSWVADRADRAQEFWSSTDAARNNQVTTQRLADAMDKVALGEEGAMEDIKIALSDPVSVLSIMAEAAPSLAAMAAMQAGTGGTGALVFGGLLEAMETYDTATEFEERTGVSIDQEELNEAMALRGVLGGLMEKLGLDSILGKSSSKALNRVLQIPGGALGEATTEAGQELLGGSIAQRYIDPDTNPLESVPAGVIGGAGSGAALGAINALSGGEMASDTLADDFRRLAQAGKETLERARARRDVPAEPIDALDVTTPAPMTDEANIVPGPEGFGQDPGNVDLSGFIPPGGAPGPVVPGEPGTPGAPGPEAGLTLSTQVTGRAMPSAPAAPESVSVDPPPAIAPEAVNIVPPARPEEDQDEAEMAPQESAVLYRGEERSVSTQVLDVADLQVDPQAYQFKQDVNQEGETGRLAGVSRWDSVRAQPVIVHERNDGSRYVADGHQRSGLARRLKTEGQDTRSSAIVLRESDGWSTQDARNYAAIVNLSQGSGTAVDAALLIRDVGEQALADEAVPMGESIVRDGIGLAKLGEAAFQAVLAGDVSETNGGIIGAEIADPDVQVAAVGVFRETPPQNMQQARMMARDVRDMASAQQESTSGPQASDLFGMGDLPILERAKVLDNAVKQLRRRRSALRNVLENEGTLQEQGAVAGVNKEAGRQGKNQAEQMIDALQGRVDTNPELNAELTKIATEVKNGSITIAEGARRFLEQAEQAQGVARQPSGTREDNAGTSGGTQAQPGAEPEASETQPEGLTLNAEQAPQAPDPAPAEQQSDLIGGRSDTEQAVADRERQLDARRQGDDAAADAAGTGGLFDQTPPTQDMLDEAGEAATQEAPDIPAAPASLASLSMRDQGGAPEPTRPPSPPKPQEETGDDAGADASVERDREPGGREGAGDADPVLDDAERDGAATRDAAQATGEERNVAEGGESIPDRGPASGGAPSRQPVHREDGKAGLEGRTSRDSDDRGSGEVRDGRGDADGRGSAGTRRASGQQQRSLAERTKAQEKVNGRTRPEVKLGKNVADSAPLLLEPQQEDVAAAEKRLFIDGARGMLFTNGTGTGKTFSAGGIIRRMVDRGKSSILVITPSQTKNADWQKELARVGVEAGILGSTTDKGEGVTITTYANFQANLRLAERDYDGIFFDESHQILQSKNHGSSRLDALNTLAVKDDDGQFYLRSKYKQAQPDYQAADAAKRAAEKALAAAERKGEPGPIQEAELALARAEDRWREVANRHDERAKELIEEGKLKNPGTKVVFLSASPFAYRESLDYADGWLFKYDDFAPKGIGAQGYNTGDGRDRFFMNHFGYIMKTNKLQLPSEMDPTTLAINEQEFYESLRKEGAVRGRQLDSEFDYERRFVEVHPPKYEDAAALVDEIREFLSPAGQEGDAKLRGLQQRFGLNENNPFDLLRAAFSAGLTYTKVEAWLEGIRAEGAIPRIREHVKLGRRVVLFHTFREAEQWNPFQALAPGSKEMNDWAAIHSAKSNADPSTVMAELKKQLDALRFAFPKIEQYQGMRVKPAAEAIAEAFGEDVVFFNGAVSKSEKMRAKQAFNGPDGPSVIMVQKQAGKEGISLHDTDGRAQRVMMSLNTPSQPTDAIQMEGRIYRVGNQSNAIFEYIVTGFNFEATAYLNKVASRASTAENLAMGGEARALQLAFVEGYGDRSTPDPKKITGVGGKARDRAATERSPVEVAKAHFSRTQKEKGRRNQRSGKDYFATPEPVGWAMMQMAGIRPGESVLEPSAGHGAIARYAPSSAKLTAIEPSHALFAKLTQNTTMLSARRDNVTFEDHDLVNKYDAIVMNPPFGQGGSLSTKHLEKAFRHLRTGGRVVALLPRGPAANKALSKLLDRIAEQEQLKSTKDVIQLTKRFGLPSQTFQEAGSSVSTQIVVFDKMPKGDPLPQAQGESEVTVGSLNELFDRVEGMAESVPARIEPSVKEAPPAKPIGVVSYGFFDRSVSTAFTAPEGAVLGYEERSPGVYYIHGETRENRLEIREAGGRWMRKDLAWKVNDEGLAKLRDQFEALIQPAEKKEQYVALMGANVAREKYAQLRELAESFGGSAQGTKFSFPTREERDAFVDSAEFRPSDSLQEHGGDTAFAVMEEREGSVEIEEMDLFEEIVIASEDTPEPERDLEPTFERFETQAKTVKVATFRTPVDRVQTLTDVAYIAQPIMNKAQEHMIYVVTDDEGRPLNVVQGVVGGTSSAPFLSLAATLGAVADIPGAARVYVVHNHPSGTASLSWRDREGAAHLQRILQESGIEYGGLMAVTPRGQFASDQASEPFGDAGRDRPAAGEVPLLEREIESQQVSATRDSIEADVAFIKARSYRSGVILKDALGRSSFFPLELSEMLGLRRGRADIGAAAIMRAIHRSNSDSSVIPVIPRAEGSSEHNRALRNLLGFTEAFRIPVNHAIAVDGDTFSGHAIERRLEDGGRRRVPYVDGLPVGPTFYSLGEVNGRGSDRAALEERFKTTLEKLRKAFHIEVVQSVADLPFTAPDATRGVVRSPGNASPTIYLVADNLTLKSFKHVLRHELVGHVGIEAILDPEAWQRAKRAIDELVKAKDADVMDVLTDITARYQRLTKDELYKEVIAHLAEREVENTLIRRVVGAFRRWMAKLGLGNAARAEVYDLITEAGRYVDRAASARHHAPPSGVSPDAYSLRPEQDRNTKLTPEQRRIREKMGIEKRRIAIGPWFAEKRAALSSISSQGVARRLQRYWLDQFAPLLFAEQDRFGKRKDAQGDDASRGGVEYLPDIAIEHSAYVAARMAASSNEIVSFMIRFGAPELVNNTMRPKKGTRGLGDLMAELGDKQNDFFAWLIAKRADQLEQQGRERNLTREEIDATLAAVSKTDEALFESVNDELQALNKAVLDIAQKAGYIDRSSRKMWESHYYTPFFRVADDDRAVKFIDNARRGIVNKGRGVRRLTGSARALNDPLQNMMLNWERLIRNSMANNAARMAVENLPDQFKPFQRTFKPETIPAGQLRKYLEQYGYTDMELEQLFGEDAFRGLARMLAMQRPPTDDPSEQVVKVWEKGRPVFYRVADPELYAALTAFDAKYPESVMWAINAARMARRVLTRTITSLLPFQIRNLIRETLNTWIISGGDIGLGSGVFAGSKEILTQGDQYQRMLLSGAIFEQGYVFQDSPKEATKAMKSALRRKLRESYGVSQLARNPAMAIYDAFVATNRVSENANRVAEYQAMKAKTGSDLEAAFAARDLLDFSMRGSGMAARLLTDTVAFLNARMQGLYKLGRSGALRPSSKQFSRGLMLTGATMALAVANRLFFAEEYDEEPDWIKDANWLIYVPVPGSDRPLRLTIPKPFELGLIYGTMPERIFHAATGPTGADDVARAAIRGTSSTLAVQAPTIVQPMLELTMNYNWFTGGPINPAWEEQLPDHLRYGHTTSRVARAVSSATQWMPDGVQLTPRSIDFLIRGHFGTVGTWVLGATDAVYYNLSDAPKRPAMRADEVPIMNVLVRGTLPPKRSQYEDDFYREWNRAIKLLKGWKKLAQEPDQDAAIQFLEQHEADIAKGEFLEDVRGELSGIRKAMQEVYESQSMTRAEKLEAIEELRGARRELSQQAMEAAEAFGG